MSDPANVWARDGDRIVGLLVREIHHARTWQQADEAAQAIFHVRLMQVSHEKESGYVSNWTQLAPESGSFAVGSDEVGK